MGSAPCARSSTATTSTSGEQKSLTDYCVNAPVFVRLYAARAAVSVGGRHQASRLINELPGGPAGSIADALMRAVLALHDDRVLDAGRLVIEAINQEVDHVWSELEPDLLELAAVVASRLRRP